jgi:hypothetical protein
MQGYLYPTKSMTMKLIFKLNHFLLLCLMIITFAGKTQFSCINPGFYSSSMGYSGYMDSLVVNNDSTNNYGCLTSIDNPLWLYFTPCDTGNTSFNMCSTGADVNYIVWGPLSSPGQDSLTAGQIMMCSDTVLACESFTLTGLVPGNYYKIMLTNQLDSTTSLTFSWTGGVTLDTTCVSPPPPIGCGSGQDICLVTTDPVMNKNIIIWNKDATQPVVNYIIEKETTTMGVFATVEVLLPTDTSAQIDSLTNPMIHADVYRISVLDTCGNIIYGTQHQNIHLTTSTSLLGYPNLNWNPYVGFYYGTYFISRGSSPATLAPYDSLSASSTAYTDYTPVTGMNYYTVSVQPPAPCTPTRAPIGFVRSNVSSASFVGIDENPSHNFVIYPNPANELLNFETFAGDEIAFTITTIEGKMVSTKSFSNVTRGSMDISGIASGTYVVTFKSSKGTGYSKFIITR